MTYIARPCGTPGMWLVRVNGHDVGNITFIPGAVEHPLLVVHAAVYGMNNPPPLEGFGGPALDMLEAYRRGER